MIGVLSFTKERLVPRRCALVALIERQLERKLMADRLRLGGQLQAQLDNQERLRRVWFRRKLTGRYAVLGAHLRGNVVSVLCLFCAARVV